MKKLTILFVLIMACQMLSSQMKCKYPRYNYKVLKSPFDNNKEAFKIIGILAGSVILEAAGDGLSDNGQKVWGHALQAASTGLLLATPFLLDIDRSKWGWYFAAYISMRIAIFDPCYNLTRGLPIDYVGSTSIWDKTVKGFDPPPGANLWGRSVFLIAAISIPINEF